MLPLLWGGWGVRVSGSGSGGEVFGWSGLQSPTAMAADAPTARQEQQAIREGGWQSQASFQAACCGLTPSAACA